MNISINLPDYDGNALDVIWEQNSDYSVKVNDNNIILTANKEGMISLAKQMLYMAYNDLPNGCHVHFDSFFTQKQDGENELVIEYEN